MVQASCAIAGRPGDDPHWAAGGAVKGMSANSITNGNAGCGGFQCEVQRVDSSCAIYHSTSATPATATSIRQRKHYRPTRTNVRLENDVQP